MILDDVKEVLPMRPGRLFVTWMLGNTCQYRCSYCNEKYNGGDLPFHPLDRVLNIMHQLPHCDMMFLGGEPTAWRDFSQMLDEAPSHVNVQIITNGAKGMRFWEKVVDRLHRVILTAHPEYVDVQKFMELTRLLDTRLIRVNLPMMPDRWDQCLSMYETFRQAGVKILPKVLLEDFGHTAEKHLSTYTLPQLAWISSHQEPDVHTMKLIRFNGDVKGTNPGELLSSEGGTNFNGWECHTPKDFMGVDADGSIYDTMCKQRRLIGHINDDTLVRPAQPVTCEQTYCWCYSDLHTRKIRHAQS